MSEQSLEKIVASLELCKLIPAGEFEDATLVWSYDRICGFICLLPDYPDETARLRNNGMLYPAPTLSEIMGKIPICNVLYESDWLIGAREKGHFYTGKDDTNPANAVLRIWLKMKGIEVK